MARPLSVAACILHLALLSLAQQKFMPRGEGWVGDRISGEPGLARGLASLDVQELHCGRTTSTTHF